MAPHDHPSVAATTPGAHSRRGGGFFSNRNYRIQHQKISIDVDLENNYIKGFTELMVVPTEPILKYIKLDCRQMEITDVLVNNRRVDYLHLDPLNDEFKQFTHQTNKPASVSDIRQHHLYKNNFKKILSGENSEELTIFMPERLKLTLNDPNTASNSHYTPSYRETPGSHRPSTTNEISYTPVTVNIEFLVKNPQNGVHFVGGKGSSLNKSEWHAYTNNSSYGISTSSWVPCIDSLCEKSTWEIDISVPRTVKDIGCPRVIGSVSLKGSRKGDLDEDDDDDDDEEDEIAEVLVIGADFANQKESPHSTDLSKKVVSYEVFNLTSAHHIGWSVGAFIQCPLINLQEEEEEEPESGNEKDTTQIPSAVYCMPSQRENAINTSIFLYKALDFYSREFGSFPFTSNAFVFVSDIDVDYAGFGGVTMFNDKLLYATNEIEPLYPTTFTLSVALAEQWSGINVVPKAYNDLWVTIGIARFMAFQFIKKLMGVNEFKYRIKKQSNLICEEDVNQRPLANPFLKYPVSVKDLDFLRLKAPLVLFILDKRMTKTDKSFGLYRVIPKIFLQAMSGDLANGCLSTSNFQHVCEKVNRNKLDTFFKQWVYGRGVPIFRVTQRFNKKRMFIEMGIRQVQQQESPKYHATEGTFLDDSNKELENQANSSQETNDGSNAYPSHSQQHSGLATLFTGPMTIRIHEADGTPYEHIVDLKEGFTKLDIQYNTKYKRLKRNKKKTDKQDASGSGGAEEEESVLLHCLGDTLQSDQEIKEWELTDWSKEEEERMSNEAFEWIRIDADFEWICQIYINQPDYMFASQLQQDRDIEAQLESVSYFSDSNPSALYSSILLRTLMDARYYYGVRVEAALGLAKFAKPQVKWIGKTHLMKTFRNLFCFPYSPIPLPNNFVDFPSYFIKKAIPLALSTIKDQNNNVPMDVRNFLLNLLKFNENLNNPYSDKYYIGHLIECISHALLVNPLVESADALTEPDRLFLKEAIDEISRHQKLDEWASVSDQKIGAISMTEKLRLARRGMFEFSIDDLLNKTQPSYSDNIRVLAFEGLFDLGALKNKTMLEYFFTSLFFEKSYAVKAQLLEKFVLSVGRAALLGFANLLDESELTKEIVMELKDEESQNNLAAGAGAGASAAVADGSGEGFVVVQEGSNDLLESKKDAIARSSIKGSIQLLRRDLAEYKPFVDILWEAVRHPLLSLNAKRDLLAIVAVLFKAQDSLIVRFEIPRQKKITATNLGKGKIVFKREGQFKITIPKKLTIKAVTGGTNAVSTTVKQPTLKMTVKAPSATVTTATTPMAVTTGKTKVAIKISKPLPRPTVDPVVKPESKIVTIPITTEALKPIDDTADVGKTVKPEPKQTPVKAKPLARTAAQGSPKKVPKFKSEIRRTKSGPLRYIRISTNRRLVVASSDPFRRKKGTGPKAAAAATKLTFSNKPLPIKHELAETSVEPEVNTPTVEEKEPDTNIFAESPAQTKLESEKKLSDKEMTDANHNEKKAKADPKPPSASPISEINSKPLPTSPRGFKPNSVSSNDSSSSTDTGPAPKAASTSPNVPSSSSTNFKKFSLKPGSRHAPTPGTSSTGGSSSYSSSNSSSAPLAKPSNKYGSKPSQSSSSPYSRQPSRAESPSPGSSSSSSSASSSCSTFKPKSNERPYSKKYSSVQQERQRPYSRPNERSNDRPRDRAHDRQHDRSHDRSRERPYSKPSHGSSSDYSRHRINKHSPPPPPPPPPSGRPYGKPSTPNSGSAPPPPPPQGRPPPPPPPPQNKPPPLPSLPREGSAPPASSSSSSSSSSTSGFGRTGSSNGNNNNSSNGPPKSKLKLKFKF